LEFKSYREKESEDLKNKRDESNKLRNIDLEYEYDYVDSTTIFNEYNNNNNINSENSFFKKSFKYFCYVYERFDEDSFNIEIINSNIRNFNINIKSNKKKYWNEYESELSNSDMFYRSGDKKYIQYD